MSPEVSGGNKMSILHPEYQIEFEAALEQLKNSIKGSKEHDNNQHYTPPQLYHYTPGTDALSGIIHSREIWLTNISYLNDTAEMDYIKTLAKDAALSSALDPIVKDCINNWTPLSASFGTQIYVMSFSSKPDYLPLWATFTKMKGYCIGFDTHALENEILSRFALNIETVRNMSASHDTIANLVKLNDPNAQLQGAYGGRAYISPIVYDRARQIEILNSVVKHAIAEFYAVHKAPDRNLGQSVIITKGKEIGRIAKDDNALKAAVNKLLDQCAVLFKSSDFAYEHEWRLVQLMDAADANLLRGQFFVREIDNSIVPYIKMKLRNDLSFPIKTIITAPLAVPDAAAACAGVRFVLYNGGYGVGGGDRSGDGNSSRNGGRNSSRSGNKDGDSDSGSGVCVKASVIKLRR